MLPFQTHHSVRVKGTENNYEPVACVDTSCRKRGPHMHCPLCVQTESYQDPVILKAHYRVKHVDKGIEFAGLKVLRCCDHCDIVGSIKGAKQFKGAHWHCYKCKNGFNRRDEAVKHYRTHFRNPQTTFQIQIAQEVNRPFLEEKKELERAAANLLSPTSQLTTIHPSLAEAAMMSVTVPAGSATTNGKPGEGEEHHVAVAANETVGTSEGQTIMIIQADDIENMSVSDQESTLENETVHDSSQVLLSAPSSEPSDWAQTKLALEDRVKELTERNSQLESEYNRQVTSLKTEIDHLKLQVQVHLQELSESQRREQELVNQLSIPLNDKIAQTLNQLKVEHENLLHQQLAVLKRSYSKEDMGVEEEVAEEEGEVGVSKGHEEQQSPILVISDHTGQHIQGSIVTVADGSQVFVQGPDPSQTHNSYPLTMVKSAEGPGQVLETAGSEVLMAGETHEGQYTAVEEEHSISISLEEGKRPVEEDSEADQSESKRPKH